MRPLDQDELARFEQACERLGRDATHELRAKRRELDLRIALKCIPDEAFLVRHGINRIDENITAVEYCNAIAAMRGFLTAAIADYCGSESDVFALAVRAKRFWLRTRDTVGTDVKQRLARESLRKCAYCGMRVEPEEAHVDHSDPVFMGGANIYSNYRYTCAECNLGKSALPEDSFGVDAYLPETGRPSARLRYLVLVRDGFQCVVCGTPAVRQQLHVTLRIHSHAGGTVCFDNLRTVCGRCQSTPGC